MRTKGFIHIILGSFLLVSISAPSQVSANERLDLFQDSNTHNTSNPLSWWLLGATLTWVGVATQFDESVRNSVQNNSSLRSDKLAALGNQWAELGGAVFTLGMWGFGEAQHNTAWMATSTTMFQSALVASLTSRMIKIGGGRLRPYQTDSSDQWMYGGSSFPSGHTTQAFALSTAFAESVPNPSFARRGIAYSLAFATAYARIHDNKHWLSDTIAGGVIGVVTAMSVVYVNERGQDWTVLITPDDEQNLQLSLTSHF